MRWLQPFPRLVAWSVLAGSLAALAQTPLPQPRLTRLYPLGLRAGSTQEVSFVGSNLDTPTGVLASDSRIRAELKPGSGSEFRLSAPADLPAGVYDLRFVGRFGVSNPRSIWIGTGPELIAPASHPNSTTAMELPVGTGVSDRVAANTASWFKSSAPEGTALVARVLATGLDSRLEPILSILDGKQHELARSARGFVTFKAPPGGAFFIKIHDVTFRGGDEFACRLELSGAPQVDFVLPAAVRAGAAGTVTVFGRNLPGGVPSPLTGRDDQPLQQLELSVELPSSTNAVPAVLPEVRPSALSLSGELVEWRMSTTNGVANPILLSRPALDPVLAVSRTNGWKPIVVRSGVPCEVHGLFPRRGETTGVRFAARKGDVLWLDLSGERNGFPVDPLAVIQRVKVAKDGTESFEDVQDYSDSDAQFGGAEFNTASRDPAGRFEIPGDGEYRILVRDLFHGAASSPRLPYRLVVRRETPSFQLVALTLPPPKVKADDRSVAAASTVLRRGEVVAVKVLAYRRDGFSGEIALNATGLPVGVVALPSRIAAGQNSGLLLLHASTNASGAAWVNILGSAAAVAGSAPQVAAPASVVWDLADTNIDPPVTRATRGFAVAVCDAEEAPVELVLDAAGPLKTTPTGTVSIPVRVIRRGDFQGAFTIKPTGRPEWDKVKEISIAEKATNATVELKIAELKAPAGAHPLWVQGVVVGKYRNQPGAIAAADEELKAANAAVAAAKPADKAAAEQRKKNAEAAKKSAEERAAPRDAAVQLFSKPLTIQIDPPAAAAPAK